MLELTKIKIQRFIVNDFSRSLKFSNVCLFSRCAFAASTPLSPRRQANLHLVEWIINFDFKIHGNLSGFMFSFVINSPRETPLRSGTACRFNVGLKPGQLGRLWPGVAATSSVISSYVKPMFNVDFAPHSASCVGVITACIVFFTLRPQFDSVIWFVG